MKIVFILVAIFFLLKLLTKQVAPLLLIYLSKKLSKKFNEQFQQHSNQNNANNNFDEIEVKEDVVGEYVDFEEID